MTATRVFVYGTLKRGFSNHHVLSSGTASRFVARGSTLHTFPLIIDAYCIPYLVALPRNAKPAGHRIHGELWDVDADRLAELDRFEGAPGRYERRETLVAHRDDADRIERASLYVLPLPRASDFRIDDYALADEYTAAHHRNFVPPGPMRDASRATSWGGFR